MGQQWLARASFRSNLLRPRGRDGRHLRRGDLVHLPPGARSKPAWASCRRSSTSTCRAPTRCTSARRRASSGRSTYLARPSDARDALARAGAEVAVVFGAIVLTTGPLWGAKAWGTFWTWDPRLTTALLSVLIYVAYLVLRAFAGDGDGERRFAAALGVLGAANLPIIHFSVQKWGGQHPMVITGRGGGLQHPDMKLALASASSRSRCSPCCSSGRARGSSSREPPAARRRRRHRPRPRHEGRGMSRTRAVGTGATPAAGASGRPRPRRPRDDVPGRQGRAGALQRRDAPRQRLRVLWVILLAWVASRLAQAGALTTGSTTSSASSTTPPRSSAPATSGDLR